MSLTINEIRGAIEQWRRIGPAPLPRRSACAEHMAWIIESVLPELEVLRELARASSELLKCYGNYGTASAGYGTDWLEWERATVGARDFGAGKGKPK